jgi:hypothetical protein
MAAVTLVGTLTIFDCVMNAKKSDIRFQRDFVLGLHSSFRDEPLFSGYPDVEAYLFVGRPNIKKPFKLYTSCQLNAQDSLFI